MTNCTNCDGQIKENFCPKCGQSAKLKRIDGKYLLNEFEHVIHLDRGIFYTIKELLIRPGKNIQEFISNDRNRLVKPILFIVITSLIYSVLSHLFHIEDSYIEFGEAEQSTTGIIFQWVNNHYGYATIIMSIFIAFFLKLFFKKYDFNFFEILILMCFVMGMGMLIFAFFTVLQGLTKVTLMPIAGGVGFLYMTWAMGQFFDKKKVGSYIKSFLAYFLGMLLFSIAVIGIGTLIDLIIKH
ncbi:MAG: hypothetical protein ACI9IP_003539 [Arcticibacterium sp.]|jgi:hypothetical protein